MVSSGVAHALRLALSPRSCSFILLIHRTLVGRSQSYTAQILREKRPALSHRMLAVAAHRHASRKFRTGLVTFAQAL